MEEKAKNEQKRESKAKVRELRKTSGQSDSDQHKGARVKQDEGKIKAPDVEVLLGEHYLKVRAAFVGAGFEDISYIVKKDIIKGWLRKDGEVSEISINGRTEIGKRAKFFPTAPVVIVYHTFKEQ